MQISKLMTTIIPLLLVSCTSSQHNDLVSDIHEQTPVERVGTIETVKPGAAIDFSHSLTQHMTAGQFYTLTMEFEEAYDVGDMEIVLAPPDQLEIFAHDTKKLFRMDKKASHTWPIDIKADQDGIYFISVFATATDQDTNFTSRRNFSIRVDVGDVTPEMVARAFPENGTLSIDGKSRLLPAQETIE